MVNLFILSWLFVIGLIVTTFSSGPLYLYTFEKRDIGLWNKPWFNCGNQSWTFLSFLSSSSLEKGLFIDSLFPIRGDLVFNHCGEKRWRHTGEEVKKILHSHLFQSPVRVWPLLQDLGSNTRKRYEQTQHIRSLNFSLHGCYALRRLATHLPETHQELALQAIDGAIQFHRGKSIGKMRPFKAPWMLTYKLEKHLRQMLLTWFFGVQWTVVTCHGPSFKIVYVKHPSLMEAICNQKTAIQDWSDDIAPPCTCAILKQFPTARAAPNLKAEHWVLDGALLAPLLPGQLAQVVGGSLNNKIFPNKKDLKKLFLEAFYNWSKLNSIPCPPEN